MYHFKVPINSSSENKPGVHDFLKASPDSAFYDHPLASIGNTQGAASLSPLALEEHYDWITKRGAVSSKFPAMDTWLQRFSTEQRLSCKKQFDKWAKAPWIGQLWKSEDMRLKRWCTDTSWDDRLGMWDDDWYNERKNIEKKESSMNKAASEPQSKKPQKAVRVDQGLRQAKGRNELG